MIQMRENRYDDIRKSTVPRSSGQEEGKSPGDKVGASKDEPPPSSPSEEQSNKRESRNQNEEEYNSWS